MYLSRPPIFEVVCGFVFEPLSLDMLDVGVFRENVRDEFPKREIHPALFDAGTIHFGHGPQRAWLVSANDELLVQIQNDRFFVNWRKRSGHYPRFSDHDGVTGLCAIALSQFSRFAEFASARLGEKVNLIRLDLSKIDLLNQGPDYSDLTDLSRLLPAIGDQPQGRNRQIQIRIQDSQDKLNSAIEIIVSTKSVRVETRAQFPPEPDLRHAFYSANDELNRAFLSLFDSSELLRRFN